jgi:hypothetical protein
MKRLIDITDEDVISVINRVHIMTDNKVISRKHLTTIKIIFSDI